MSLLGCPLLQVSCGWRNFAGGSGGVLESLREGRCNGAAGVPVRGPSTANRQHCITLAASHSGLLGFNIRLTRLVPPDSPSTSLSFQTVMKTSICFFQLQIFNTIDAGTARVLIRPGAINELKDGPSGPGPALTGLSPACCHEASGIWSRLWRRCAFASTTSPCFVSRLLTESCSAAKFRGMSSYGPRRRTEELGQEPDVQSVNFSLGCHHWQRPRDSIVNLRVEVIEVSKTARWNHPRTHQKTLSHSSQPHI